MVFVSGSSTGRWIVALPAVMATTLPPPMVSIKPAQSHRASGAPVLCADDPVSRFLPPVRKTKVHRSKCDTFSRRRTSDRSKPVEDIR